MTCTVVADEKIPVAYAIYAICSGRVVLMEVKRMPVDDQEEEEWKYDDGGYGDYWAGNEPLYIHAGATCVTPAVRDAILEAAAKECDAVASAKYDQYKGRGQYTEHNPGSADAFVNGESTGAELCAARIRALKVSACEVLEAIAA